MLLMDFSLPFLPFVILFLSVSIVFIVYKRKSSSVKLPPGRKGWPFLGESLEYMMANRRGQPEKFIKDRMSKYSQDLFKTSLLGENFAVFCGPAGNKLLFTSGSKFVKTWIPRSASRLLTDSNTYDDEWSTSFKKILLDFLNPQALKSYIPVMDSMTREHLQMMWSPYKQVKGYALSRKHTFALACRLFLSVKDPNIVSRLSDLYDTIAAGMLSVPINFPGTQYNKAVEAREVIFQMISGIMVHRKVELWEKVDTASQDLLTAVLLYKDEHGSSTSRSVNEREIVNSILGLLFASHETTSSPMAFILKFLVEHPQVYSKVFQEHMEILKSKGPNELLNWDDIKKMKYTWCVACETMRLLPPAHGSFREAIADFAAYQGFTIPKGWKIYWTPHSTHKNPQYFPDPEKFDPSRFEGEGPAPYTFVPFGGGPHMCSGKEYARLVILIYMHNVITKFKWKKVIGNEKIRVGVSHVPMNGFPIHLEPF